MDKILFIGGHGMLGRPVIRHLVDEGFTVRVLARDPEKARALLPPEAEVVQGDLEDVSSVKSAAEGFEAVYLNLETPDPKASFKQDLDGPRNVIEALQGRPDVLIAKISGYGLRHTNGWWPNSDLKHEAEELIKASGHPWLFFHPTWFMESLNLFVRGDKATLFGSKWYPKRWIAGHDFARMVCQAFERGLQNRTFTVQGPENLDYDQALGRFLAVRAPGTKISHIPIFVLRVLGIFVPFAHDFHRLFYIAATEEEAFLAQDTWDELYKPEMKIEDYCRYIDETGDIPKKG